MTISFWCRYLKQPRGWLRGEGNGFVIENWDGGVIILEDGWTVRVRSFNVNDGLKSIGTG